MSVWLAEGTRGARPRCYERALAILEQLSAADASNAERLRDMQYCRHQALTSALRAAGANGQARMQTA